MIVFLQQVISGAAVGLVYALVALGFVMIQNRPRCSISHWAN
jgi:branched-subunit amino acid ABC-type transport system permease component